MSHIFTWKKILLVALLATFFLPQFFGSYAMAQTAPVDYGAAFQPAGISDGVCSWRDPKNWLTCIFLVPISWFVGLLVSLGAWAITLGLEMNAGLAYTTPIQSGFNVTLAIANLGFVFAIIVIAIATIIGYESYGLKKNLWKLVAAALLVNFSLVICALIIGFFDQFAYYFARQMGNQGGGYSGVANHLVNAFQLNKLSAWQGALSLVPTFIFIIIFLLIIAFTLFAVALTLIVRYFYLALLMILMPFAWLAWLIPGMQKHWDSWWENFIKWTISPTVLLTFLYIAILITNSAANPVNGVSQIDQWVNPSLAGPGQLLNASAGSGQGESFVSVIMRMMIGLALVWGALIASNSMGAKGASTAMSWSKSVGKSAGNYSARWGKRGSRRLYNKLGGESLTKGLQNTQVYSGQNRFLRFISAPVRLGAQNAGYGLEKATLATTEGLIKDAKKRSEGLTLDQKINNFDTADLPTRIAWIEEIKEKGRLHEIRNVEQYLGKDKEDAEKKKEAFSRYGKGKLFDEARFESGLHLMQLSQALEKAMKANDKATSDQTEADIKAYFKGAPGVGALAETFFQDFNKLKSKGKKLPFGLEPDSDALKLVRQSMAIAVAKQFSPSNMSEFFKKLTKGDQLDMFRGVTKELNGGNGLERKDFEDRNLKWMESNGARNMGIGLDLYGIK